MSVSIVVVIVALSTAGASTAPSAMASPGDPFKTVDEAALDALEYLKRTYPQHVNFEYGGCLYKEGEVFKATLPDTYHPPKSGFCTIPEPPPGTTKAGDYHNHTSKEDFSVIDMTTKQTTPQYLLTPKGTIKKFTPTDKKVIILRGSS